MQNKTNLYIFVAVMSLFFASTAVAWQTECEEPYCCVAEDVGKDDWQFRLVGPVLVTDPATVTQCTGLGDECYKYTYEIESYGGDNISLAFFTIPNKYGEEVEIVGQSDSYKYAPAGAGGGSESNYFAEDVQEIRVAEIPPNNDDGNFVFYSNIGSFNRITGYIKSGKSYGGCAIAGPDPNGYDPNEVYTISAVVEMATSDNRFFRLKENLQTECIEAAWEITALGGTVIRPLEPALLEDNVQYYSNTLNKWEKTKMIGDRNQRCRRAILKSWDDNNTWVWISGKRVWR